MEICKLGVSDASNHKISTPKCFNMANNHKTDTQLTFVLFFFFSKVTAKTIFRWRPYWIAGERDVWPAAPTTRPQIRGWMDDGQEFLRRCVNVIHTR